MIAKLKNVWVLIPARGGSKGIPRKNLRLLAGKPLILYVLEEISSVLEKTHIIVSTEDEEIAKICNEYALIHHRSSTLARDESTLDDVAVEVARWLTNNGAKEDDFFLTIQPTSPLIKKSTIIRSLQLLKNGTNSVLSVKDDRHLQWTIDERGKPSPLYLKRVNRQLLPPTLTETGGIIGSRIGDVIFHNTRIVEPIALLELNNEESLDIDTYSDWVVAEYYINRKCIVIRADANPEMGMGHVYRAIALAHEFAEHDIRLITRVDEVYKLGADFLRRHPFPVDTVISEPDFLQKLAVLSPDMVVLDILDTTKEAVENIGQYSKFIVSLENLGTGIMTSDIVINDLYTDLYPQKNHWYGVNYAILNPQFEMIEPKKSITEDVKNILLAFGGTDPKNLTVKTLLALKKINFHENVNVVLGPGYNHEEINLSAYNLKGTVLHSVDNMAVIMREADIAITSAGRTVTELMTLGVPMIVMCQNRRELQHTHASSPFGVINLGLGEMIESISLEKHLLMLISDFSLRQEMHVRMLNATRNRSNKKIAQMIFSELSSKSIQNSKGNVL